MRLFLKYVSNDFKYISPKTHQFRTFLGLFESWEVAKNISHAIFWLLNRFKLLMGLNQSSNQWKPTLTGHCYVFWLYPLCLFLHTITHPWLCIAAEMHVLVMDFISLTHWGCILQSASLLLTHFLTKHISFIMYINW